MASGRLRVLYLVPGHGLMSTAGPTRNVLSLAAALQPYADITVAFRSVIDAEPPSGLEIREIEPASSRDREQALDDSAMRGMSYTEFAGYLRQLRDFTTSAAGEFDVILEKSWLLSGWLSLIAERHGRLGVAVENVVPSPRRHDHAGKMKQLRVLAGRWWAGRCLRRCRLIIAETPQLKTDILEVWHVAERSVAVVGLGVDRARFRPIDQREARRAMTVQSDATVLVYVGLLDETHNLAPAIEAIAASDRTDLQLHIVGDGPSREAYRACAASSPRVVFHGRVPHDAVPHYIAVADLCLAPYDSRAFASGALGYSTMKIPEYLAVGRPVVAAPAERARELIEDGATGFLMPNDAERWRTFVASTMPSRSELAAMGRRATGSHLPSWDETARGYLAAIERAMAERRE